MTRFELVHTNRLECEIGRYPVVQDDAGAPLMLATVAQDVDVRQALDVLEPGDRLELVEIAEDPRAMLHAAIEATELAAPGQRPGETYLEAQDRRSREILAPADPFAPGAILYSSWGYDQTNIDFYRVEKHAGDWITLQKLLAVEESDGPGSMTGRVKPHDPPQLIGTPFRRKLLEPSSSGAAVKIKSYAFAYPWDGQPKRVSHYG